MLNLLLTILNYKSLKETLNADNIEDSQALQSQQMLSSAEETDLQNQQTQEEALVEMDLGAMEDVSDEDYMKAMQKLSQIANKFEVKMQKLLADNQAKEKQIEQKITAREPRMKALDADIESLQETLDKRTEEQFSYMQD